jgi:GT2 family glycosyltransferase
MAMPLVTILVPNYKTLDLTKLCLRLLRCYTQKDKIEVIVIDNASQDESIEYLRSVKWIRLIERSIDKDATPGNSHARALDEALAQVTTPYVLSFHTDTMVKKDGWLELLLAEIGKNPNIAGVGSWKLESKPVVKQWAKKIEMVFQSIIFPLIGKGYGKLEGKGGNFLYLRSHCALYRTDLLRKYKLSFADGEDTAGKGLHRRLVEHGHEMVFLPTETLSRYMLHLNHATGALNPQIRENRKHVSKDLKRIGWYLRQLDAEKILADDSLDQ